MSTGPFNISVGDSVKVAFALIAGDDLNDIKASADSAQTHYTPPVPTNITNNTSGEMNVSVFPNPANTDLSFVINTIKSENIDITLVNTLGQTVKHIIKNNVNIGYNQINADVSQLPVGTYYYQIKTEGSSIKGKVIITK